MNVISYLDYDIDNNRWRALAPTNPPATCGASVSKMMGHGHHLKRRL